MLFLIFCITFSKCFGTYVLFIDIFNFPIIIFFCDYILYDRFLFLSKIHENL